MIKPLVGDKFSVHQSSFWSLSFVVNDIDVVFADIASSNSEWYSTGSWTNRMTVRIYSGAELKAEHTFDDDPYFKNIIVEISKSNVATACEMIVNYVKEVINEPVTV